MLAAHPSGLLEKLLPLHLMIDPGGKVLQAGPLLIKAFKGRELVGRPITEIFRVRGALRLPFHSMLQCLLYGRRLKI